MKRRGNGEGSFSTKPDGRIEWRYYVNGERKRLMSRKGESLKDFRVRVTKFLSELDRGITAPADNRLTLGEYLDDWLARQKRHIAYGYYRRHEESIRLTIKPLLGKIPLTKLMPQHIQRMYDQMFEAGAKPNTVEKRRITLRKALNDALRLDLVSRNVAMLVSLPQVKKQTIPTYTADDSRRLIEASRGERLHAMIVLMETTGCRPGELLGQQWQWINLDLGIMEIMGTIKEDEGHKWVLGVPKTEQSRRTIYLTQEAITALHEHHAQQLQERLLNKVGWNPQGLVFPSRAGTLINPNNFRNRDYTRIVEKAGLRYIWPHAGSRHSVAEQLLRNGAPMQDVQGYLGHTKIGTTIDNYGHVVPGGGTSMRDRMERMRDNQKEVI